MNTTTDADDSRAVPAEVDVQDNAEPSPLLRMTAEIQAMRLAFEQERRVQDERFRLLVHALTSQRVNTCVSPAARPSRPVFVLGCVRSGTTAVGNALRRAGLPGWLEGHVFPLLHYMRNAIDQHMETEKPFLGSSNLTINELAPQLLELIVINYFERLHLEWLQTTRWIDKTPGIEMIEAAPYLQQIWPQARFIYCRRRGIENVKSQLRRFGNDPMIPPVRFLEACHVWARCMESWLDVREQIGNAFIEIDQAEMAADPHRTARALGALLELAPDQIATLHQALRDDRPEQTATSDAAEALEATGWTPTEQEQFLIACGPAMTAYGYSLGGELDDRIQRALLLAFTTDPDRVTLHNADSGYKPAEYGTFLLHPSMEGGPATVIFKTLPFARHSQFYAQLELRHPQSQPVCYQVRITDSASGAEQVCEQITIAPGPASEWRFNFAPLEGAMDVALSTEMALGGRNNFYAWSFWRGPRFLLDHK